MHSFFLFSGRRRLSKMYVGMRRKKIKREKNEVRKGKKTELQNSQDGID